MGNPLDSPLMVVFMFILRCLVPIFLLMVISYFLRKWGLVSTSGEKPPDDKRINNNSIVEGGFENGKP